MISVPTKIKGIVDLIRANESYTGDAPYFDFGYHQYIANQIDLKSKSKNYYDKLFPFVGLILPIEQTMYPHDNVESLINFNVILAYPTKRDTTPSEQQTDVFQAILHPLYVHFLEWMYKSGYFLLQNEEIEHKRTDHYLYGADGNQWNMNVCAIELNFTDINLLTLETC